MHFIFPRDLRDIIENGTLQSGEHLVQSMLGAVDALARGRVAHKETVYQDLAICDLVLQHFRSYSCSPSAGTPLGAVGTQRLGEAHGWGGSLGLCSPTLGFKPKLVPH